MPPVLVTVPPILKVLKPPLRVPAVRIHPAEKVCTSAVPASRFNVPPTPFSVKLAPPMFPVKVAAPAVLVIRTIPVEVPFPVVVKLPIF